MAEYQRIKEVVNCFQICIFVLGNTTDFGAYTTRKRL